MEGVNSRSANFQPVGTATPVRRAEVSQGEPTVSVDGDSIKNEARLTALATQLSAAAERAAQRDGQLSRSELADLAARIMDRLGGVLLVGEGFL